jgi:homocysteine S-methyltransferase
MLERKIDAGAHFSVTTPVFSPEQVASFLADTQHCGIPMIAAVRPLASHREAEYLDNEVPGISIPDSLVRRMGKAGTPERAREEGSTIARETIRALRGMVQGIELIIGDRDYLRALEIFNAS